MADIIYDIEKIETAKNAIDDLINTLNNDNNALERALNNLQTGWQTDAGQTFFEDHQDTWSKYVEKYVKKLTGVSDMLQKAISHYENIGNEVENLKA